MSNPNLPLGIALVCGAAACALTLAVVPDLGLGGGVVIGALTGGASLIFTGQQKPTEEKEREVERKPKGNNKKSDKKSKKKEKKVTRTPSPPPREAPSTPEPEQKKAKKKAKKEAKPDVAPKSPAPKSPAPKSAPKSPAPAPQQAAKAKTPQKPAEDTKAELTKTQLAKLKKKQKKESEEKAKADEKALEAKREAAQVKKAAKAASKKKEVASPQAQAQVAEDVEDIKEEVLEDGWEKPKPRNTVRIRNPQDDKKRREAQKARSLPTPSAEGPKVVSEVRVPKAKHGLIIGQKGATLALIQKHTGATVTMPKREGGGLGVIVAGSADQVKEASEIVRDLALKGYSQLTHPNFQSGEIILENNQSIGRIAGAGGKFLRDIQQGTGATLQLPDKSAPRAVINISGKLEQITNAKLAIMSLLDQGYSEYTHPGWVTEEHEFKSEFLGRLIGTRGERIRELSEQHDVKIDTPKEADVKQDYISIKGTPENIQAAKAAIDELLVVQEAPEDIISPDPDWQENPQEAEW